jgi:hypothetical protein
MKTAKALPLLDRRTSMIRPDKVSFYEYAIRMDAYHQLVQGVRALCKGRDVIYHGTRYPTAILNSGTLACSPITPKVAFTRSPEEAAYWATLWRDEDEGRGAVLAFDRRRLCARYRLECVVDAASSADEQEEFIWRRNVDLASGLIGFVSEPYFSRNHDERLTARKIAEKIRCPKRRKSPTRVR